LALALTVFVGVWVYLPWWVLLLWLCFNVLTLDRPGRFA